MADGEKEKGKEGVRVNIAAGVRIRVTGLITSTELNELEGVEVRFDEKPGRWNCPLDNGMKKWMKR